MFSQLFLDGPCDQRADVIVLVVMMRDPVTTNRLYKNLGKYSVYAHANGEMRTEIFRALHGLRHGLAHGTVHVAPRKVFFMEHRRTEDGEKLAQAPPLDRRLPQ